MIVNNKVIKKRVEKAKKRSLRDAKSKLRKGHIFDSYTFAAHLNSVDDQYAQIKADISNLTSLKDYPRVRREKLAETRQLIDFFNHDYHELNTLLEIVNKKAVEAGRLDDLKNEKRASINVANLKDEYAQLVNNRKGSLDE